MTDLQGFWCSYAKLLQQLARSNYSLSLQVQCDVPEDEAARMPLQENAPLKAVSKLIRAGYAWNGQIYCLFKPSDLQVPRDRIRPLTNLLKPASSLLNVLAEAMIESHRDDFLKFIDAFEPEAWQQGCVEQGTCGLSFDSKPEVGSRFNLAVAARFVVDLLRAGESRKPAALPHHTQIARYATTLLRLARERYPVKLTGVSTHYDTDRADGPERADEVLSERWQGDFSGTVNQPDLGVSVSYVKSFRPLLGEKPEFTNWLAEAMLAARLDEFEGYITEITPNAWEYASVAHRHRNWGLRLHPALKDEPYKLEFVGHVSRIAGALNERMLSAAMEGAR